MSKLSDKEFNRLIKELKEFYNNVGFENDKHYILGHLRTFYFQLYLDVIGVQEQRNLEEAENNISEVLPY